MRRLRQWTLKHPLQFVSAFMLVYFTWFSLLEKYAQPVLMIHSKLDDKIPFCEYFIVPYLLWFVWNRRYICLFLHKVKRWFLSCLPLYVHRYDCLPDYLHTDSEWIESETGDNQQQYFFKTGRHDLDCGYGNECLPVDSCVQQYCNQYGYPAFQCL